MGIKSRFCAKCGNETDSTFEGLCADCLLEANPVGVPRKIILTHCGKCGSMYHKGVWVESDMAMERYAEIALVEKAKISEAIHLDNIDVKGVGAASKVVVNYTIMGKKYAQDFTVAIVARNITCKLCGRIAGKAHRAILQLRAVDNVDEVLETAEEMVKAPGSKFIVLKSQQFSNGVDLYMLDKRITVLLAQRLRKLFGGKITETHKLSGWDKSKNRPQRITSVLLRI